MTMSIDGWTADGFEGVRDAFEKNFADDREVGAAFSAYHRGQKVADLWGGVADEDTGTAWQEDTLALVFSTTKGWTAMAANQLIEQGKLDIGAPVAQYWPEFAAAGKQDVTVEQLMSHQAGLEWVTGTDLTLSEVLKWDPIVEALATQTPRYEPGTSHGYHALTFGWLVGELIRRVSGMTVGQYVQAHFAEPLELDLWVGLPEQHESRVCKLIGGPDPSAMLPDDPDDPIAQMLAPFLAPDGVLTKALRAGLSAFDDPDIWNGREIHAAEIPAANGICDARSLARLYGACVSDVDGVRVLSPQRVTDATTQRTSGPNTVLLNADIQFGLGFMVPTPMLNLGPGGFGHFGAGGAVGWADPETEFGFGYIMNKMTDELAGDPRSADLVTACYEAVK